MTFLKTPNKKKNRRGREVQCPSTDKSSVKYLEQQLKDLLDIIAMKAKPSTNYTPDFREVKRLVEEFAMDSQQAH